MIDNTFIIVTWNNEKQIGKLLDSIYNFEKNSKIIIFDNNSSDNTVKVIRKNRMDVNLITSNINLGFAKANNIAVDNAQTEFITIINPDTQLITPVVEKMKKKYIDEIGIIGTKLVDSSNQIQPSVYAFQNPLNIFIEQFGLGKYLPNAMKKTFSPENYDYKNEEFVDWVIGAFLFFKRDTYLQIGGFSEDYFMYSEDMDICYKCHLKKLKVLFDPSIAVMHIGGASEKQDITAQKSSKLIHSFMIFADKYNYKLNRRTLIFCYTLKYLAVRILGKFLKGQENSMQRYKVNLKLLRGWNESDS